RKGTCSPSHRRTRRQLRLRSAYLALADPGIGSVIAMLLVVLAYTRKEREKKRERERREKRERRECCSSPGYAERSGRLIALQRGSPNTGHRLGCLGPRLSLRCIPEAKSGRGDPSTSSESPAELIPGPAPCIARATA